MNVQSIRLFIFTVMLLFGGITVSISQTVTLECYYQDTIQNSDCVICNKPADREVFTGIIVNYASVPARRVKIYFNYEIKVRGQDVLIYDDKSHSAFFSLDSTPQFHTREALQTWLRYCHFQPRVEVYKISHDTVFYKLTRDSLRFIKLPGGFVDTDEQRITDFHFHMDTLYIKLERDPDWHSVYLGDLISMSGSDKQRFDRNEIINDTLFQSLQRDSVDDIKLDLKPYKDNTDSQSLRIFHPDSLLLTRLNFSSSKVYIPENQYLDTFMRVGFIVYASIKEDGMTASQLDLSIFQPQTLTNSGTTIATQTLNQISGLGGGHTTWKTTTGISLNHLSDTITLTVADISPTNELQIIDTFIVKKTTKGDSVYISVSSDGQPVKSIFLNKHLDSAWFKNSVDSLYLRVRDTILAVYIPDSVGPGVTDLSYTTITPSIYKINSSTGTDILLRMGTNMTASLSSDTLTINSSFADNYVDSVLFTQSTRTLLLSRTGLLSDLTAIIPDSDSQSISIFGSVITLQRGGSITLPAYTDNDNYVDSAFFNNPTRVLRLGRTGILSDLSVTIPDSDAQGLGWGSISANIANQTITGGTGNQFLSNSGLIFSNVGGALKLSVVDSSASNEIQTHSFTGITSTTSNLVLSLNSSTVGINVAGGLTISGNASGITITNTVVDNDNYVNGLSFVNGTRTLTATRTGVLPALSVVIPDSDNQNLFFGTVTSTSAPFGISNGTGVNVLLSPGLSWSGTHPSITLSVDDQSATNEIQTHSFTSITSSSSSLVLSLNSSTVGINVAGNLALSGNASGITITGTDNYVDSFLLNSTTNVLKIGRNILPDISVDLNTLIDHDWYNYRTKKPPTAITDTIYTKNFVGINDTTPDTELDVEGVFNLRNRNNVSETRIGMNWDVSSTPFGLSDYVYHIDFNRDPGDVSGTSATYQGFIDYHLINAYPNVVTGTYGKMVFGLNNGGNSIANPLVLIKDTAIVDNARIFFQLKDKDGDAGTTGQILSSTAFGIDWINAPISAGSGILLPLITTDTVGFIHTESHDTVEFVITGTSSGAITISHTGTTSLTSTFNPSVGSISITPGTQIEVLPTISGTSGTAKIRTNFNGYTNTIGYFGTGAGSTNDSILTDPPFFYRYEEGFGTLNVPVMNLTQTNPYKNAVPIFIADSSFDRVYVSGVDASGFSTSTFYHKVTTASSISVPAGFNGPCTHWFLNDGFAFTLNRSLTETIDGGTSVSFTATDKLVSISTDGSGKWFTTKSSGGAGVTDLTYGIATATSDTLKSSTGTDVLIKTGGTLQIDSATSSSIRIKDNKIFYSVPTFSASPGFTPYTTVTSSTSPTLDINSTYIIYFVSNATINTGGAGISLKLNSATAGWTATGKFNAATNNSGGEITIQQQSINTDFGQSGSNPPTGFNFLLDGTWILKTNGTAGTIFWSVSGNGAPMTLTNIRVIIEKV